MSCRSVTIFLLLFSTSSHGMLQQLKDFSTKFSLNTTLKSVWKHKEKVIGFGVGSVVFLGGIVGAYKIGQAQGGQAFENGIKEVLGQYDDDRPVIFTWKEQLIKNRLKARTLDLVKKKLENEVFLDGVPDDFNIKQIDNFIVDQREMGEEKDEKLFKILHPDEEYDCSPLESDWYKKLVSLELYKDLGREFTSLQVDFEKRELDLKRETLKLKKADLKYNKLLLKFKDLESKSREVFEALPLVASGQLSKEQYGRFFVSKLLELYDWGNKKVAREVEKLTRMLSDLGDLNFEDLGTTIDPPIFHKKTSEEEELPDDDGPYSEPAKKTIVSKKDGKAVVVLEEKEGEEW